MGGVGIRVGICIAKVLPPTFNIIRTHPRSQPNAGGGPMLIVPKKKKKSDKKKPTQELLGALDGWRGGGVVGRLTSTKSTAVVNVRGGTRCCVCGYCICNVLNIALILYMFPKFSPTQRLLRIDEQQQEEETEAD